jgi:hypothetical protein
MRYRLAGLGAVLACIGCVPAVSEDLPPFVLELIESHEAAPVANPPASIWRYKYKGRVVFYVPPACCDVPSELYDSDGSLICGPDGGLTGRGDGKCPDFFEQRVEGLRVWGDHRANPAL